ncbi:MAG TPA: hypothetical protein VF540_06995, partial [Segetibacter sp.]
MEELFRRAGEEYPLNTGSGDWDKVMQRLHHNQEDVRKTNKKQKDYRYLWLLLLLPLGFMLGRYFDKDQKVNPVERHKEVAITIARPGKTVPTTSPSGSTNVNTNGIDRKPELAAEVPAKAATVGRAKNSGATFSAGLNKNK